MMDSTIEETNLEVEGFQEILTELGTLPVDPPPKRETCNVCKRPVTVCWCPFLPHCQIVTQSRVIIIQHPKEEKRCLRTAPMIQAALIPGKSIVIKTTKVTTTRDPLLSEVVHSPESLLLYPAPDAISMTSLPPVSATGKPYNIILLDGTWAQAHSMYLRSPPLHNIRCVKLEHEFTSEFIIRTQPTDTCLSTVESAAVALAYVEDDPSIIQTLIRPLQALCHFQMEHGAVRHHSKEQRILQATEYVDNLPKRTRRQKGRYGLESPS